MVAEKMNNIVDGLPTASYYTRKSGKIIVDDILRTGNGSKTIKLRGNKIPA